MVSQALLLTSILAPVIGGIVQQAIASGTRSSYVPSRRGRSLIRSQFTKRKKIKRASGATRVHNYNSRGSKVASDHIREIRSRNGAQSTGIQLL